MTLQIQTIHLNFRSGSEVQGKPVLCYTILSLKEQDYFRSHSQRSASIKDKDIPNQSTARLVALEEEDDYLFLFLLIADSG
ncbi:MAG: hypothetical protein WBZ20_09245 [Nitrososphaeraceae archaeon]